MAAHALMADKAIAARCTQKKPPQPAESELQAETKSSLMQTLAKIKI